MRRKSIERIEESRSIDKHINKRKNVSWTRKVNSYASSLYWKGVSIYFSFLIYKNWNWQVHKFINDGYFDPDSDGVYAWQVKYKVIY